VDDDREDRAATVPMQPRPTKAFEVEVPPGPGVVIVRVECYDRPVASVGAAFCWPLPDGSWLTFRAYRGPGASAASPRPGEAHRSRRGP
jgi:hypothetical protein